MRETAFSACSTDEHARQHGTLDAEALVVEVDRLVAGGRALHGQVQPQLRMRLRRVGEQARVGDDDRVHAEAGRAVHGRLPLAPRAGLGKGVERDEHLRAVAVGVVDAVADRAVVEIEAREVARVRLVLEAEIDVVGAVVDGDLQRRRRAGGAHEPQARGGLRRKGNPLGHDHLRKLEPRRANRSG